MTRIVARYNNEFFELLPVAHEEMNKLNYTICAVPSYFDVENPSRVWPACLAGVEIFELRSINKEWLEMWNREFDYPERLG